MAADLWDLVDLDAPELPLLRTLALAEPTLDTVKEQIVEKSKKTFNIQLED